MKFIAIIAMLCTVFSTLCAVVFCMAMGANASPAEVRMLKQWMAGFALLGIAGIVAGIYLLRVSEPGLAAMAAFAPTVISFIIFVIAVYL